MEEKWKHIRNTYDFIDLLGDIGGITEVVMLTFSFFLLPLAEYQFTLSAAKRLFYARTKDANLF